MNKRIKLLLTLIVSLIICVSSVDAAKELTCIYDHKAYKDIMIYQNTKGEVFAAIAHDDAGAKPNELFDNDDVVWNTCDLIKKSAPDTICEYDFKKTSAYSGGELIRCPAFLGAEDRIMVSYKNVFHFFDKDGFLGIGRSNLVIAKDKAHRVFEKKMPDDVKNKIDNTDWFAKCVYSGDVDTFHLYFNDSDYLLYNETLNNKISDEQFSEHTKLVNLFSRYKMCPYYIYKTSYDFNSTGSIKNDVKYSMSITTSSSLGCRSLDPSNEVSSAIVCVSEYYIDAEKSEYFVDTYIPPVEDIDDCGDLFSDEFLEKIDEFMFYIKIVVPILLIGYGVFDFTKAIFAGSQDDMKKCQQLFFKRLIGALLVFLSPIFIKLMLELGNSVWGVINPNTCVK